MNRQLYDFLERNQIHYTTVKHSPAYTSQETAELSHISAKELAKTVIIKVDGKLAMVVLPAHHKVNFNKMKKMTGARRVDLANESDFQSQFPDCELGAMPPFGNLYHMDVFVENDLTKDKEIAFNSGTHTELVKLSYNDYKKLVHPRIIK